MIESPFEARNSRSALKTGCLLLLVTGGVILGIFLLLGRRVEREVKRQALDPAYRFDRARQWLGVERLPPGFDVRMVVDAPLLGQVGAFEMPADGDEFLVERAREILLLLLADRASSTETGTEDRALRRLLDLRGLSLEHQRLIDRHEWSAGSARVEQRLLRATLRWKPDGGRAVLASIAEFSCRGQAERRRLMLWIVTDPAPERELEPLDVQGTPADRRAAEQFYSQFDLCRSSTDQSLP